MGCWCCQTSRLNPLSSTNGWRGQFPSFTLLPSFILILCPPSIPACAPIHLYFFKSTLSWYPPPPPARVHAHTHTRQCFHLNPNWALPSQMPSADPIPIFLIISSYCCSAHPPTLDTHLHAQTDTHTQFLLKNNMKSCRMEKLDKAKGVVLGSSRFLTTLQHTLLHSAFVCVFVCPHVHVCSCLPVGLSQTSQAH